MSLFRRRAVSARLCACYGGDACGLQCRESKCAQEVNRMSRAIQSKLPVLAAPLLGLALLVGAQAAVAKGCLKGAVVGGVAGHVAGHHAVAGAVVGCAVGHHLAVKKEREERAEREQAQAAAARQAAPASAPRPSDSSW